MANRPQGLYYEEFEQGVTMTTRGRTVTEADLVNFAGLTGDYNPMHTDAEFAKSTMFGQRIAHGMLGLSYLVGLVYQLGFLEGTIIAFIDVTCKFRAPIMIGETIHGEVTIGEKKDAERMGGGMIIATFKIVKQDGTVSQKGEMTFLMKKRPAIEANHSQVTGTAGTAS